MVLRPHAFAARALVVLGLLAAPATCWAIGVEGGGKKPPTPETLTFQPAVWEPYIPELYVKPMPGGEGNAKAILKMEKPEGELPGIHQAWKSLKQRFGFDNLGARNEATAEILSGWTTSDTGFLVHATSQIAPSGDAKSVEQMIPEAPALFYASVGIDFGTKLRADREAYLLGKYFKAIELKITAHEIPSTKESPAFMEDIRGTSNPDPFLILFNFDVGFNRPWTELGGNLTAKGAPDRDLPPWRARKLVELKLALEVEGKLDDAEEGVRKKTMGAIRFIITDPKSVNIDVLSRDREKK